MKQRVMFVGTLSGFLMLVGGGSAHAEAMAKPKVKAGDYYSKTYRTTFDVRGLSDARPVAAYDYNLWTVKRGNRTVIRKQGPTDHELSVNLPPGRYTATRVNKYEFEPGTTWRRVYEKLRGCRVVTTKTTPIRPDETCGPFRIEADLACGDLPIMYTGQVTLPRLYSSTASWADIPYDTPMTYVGEKRKFVDTARTRFRVAARNSAYITTREWRSIKIGMSRDTAERIIGGRGWAEYTSAISQVRGYKDSWGDSYYITYTNGRVFSKH